MKDVAQAAQAIASGGLVLHATEGVWGFACNPQARHAVERIVAIKGRSWDKGFIVIGAQSSYFEAELGAIEADRRRGIEATWPGPHTWILPNVRFAEWITGARSTVACRVVGHEQARALCRAFGGPLVSTSANVSGTEPAVDEADARARFASEVDFVLSGQVLNPGEPSTIHALDGSILRGQHAGTEATGR